MKNRNYLAIIIIFFGFIFYGCIVSKNSIKYSSIVKIQDNIYFDETEVDVGSWISYYSWILENKGWNEAQKVLPDSSALEPEVWKYINHKSAEGLNILGRYTGQPVGFYCKKCSDFIQYEKWLNPIPERCPFLDFPITGLTYNQVIDFCKWRTTMLGDNELVFRLPSNKEWTEFALKGLSENEKFKGQKDSLINNCQTFNYESNKLCNNSNSGSKQNGIGRYIPEKSGAFDVFGNVSEMTNEIGVSKGGNYQLFANQCHIDSVQHYNRPEKWLGFRCIAVRIDGNKIHSNLLKDKQILNDSASTVKMHGKVGIFTDNRDGRVYKVVKIGQQIWMSENLAYKPDNGKYWSYYSQENIPIYGYLYNWETAQNVCPVGWHLPDKSEFETLLQNIGGDGSSAYKELVTTGNSGFSMLEGGLHFWFGYNDSHGTALWSSSEDNKKVGTDLCRGGYAQTARIDYFYKSSGLYVRCIKDKN